MWSRKALQVTTRDIRVIAGESSPREAPGIITKKQTAFSNAHCLDPWRPVEMIKLYQRSVRANCSRLYGRVL